MMKGAQTMKRKRLWKPGGRPRRGIGGSDAAAVLGIFPFRTSVDLLLYREKVLNLF